MIEILGQEGTSEHAVAMRVSKAFIEHWRGIDKSNDSEEWIKIVSGAKLSGYKVSDIDLVIVGKLGPNRRFVPKLLLRDDSGKLVNKKPIEVTSFVIALEVKDHNYEGVKFNGDDVNVYYSRGAKKGWKSATEQNVNQVHALSSYFKDRMGITPYVYRCLVMNGLDSIRVAGTLPRAFDIPQLLSSCLSINTVKYGAGKYWMSSAEPHLLSKLKEAPLFKVMKPSNLDRRRMDAIIAGLPIGERLLESLGQTMTIIRGHGGTGKTILLLHTAIKRFQQSGDRTLILTYNLALASDIRRSLTLLGVPSDPEEGGVSVVTVMSHTLSWLMALEVCSPEQINIRNYESLCLTAIEMLKEGAIIKSDLEIIKDADPDAFDFNNVFVDEAQDWPQYECDFLLRLYDSRNIIIADGIDQILRGRRTSWKSKVSEIKPAILNLDTSLRMKDNITSFVSAIASDAGLPWILRHNPFAGGGKIVLVEADDGLISDIFKKAVIRSVENGNSEIDSLICVPNSDIMAIAEKRSSRLGITLQEFGLEVWNGIDKSIRKNYPDNNNQCRIVHYESCRGLEGWVTLLHMADQYWSDCYLKRTKEGLYEVDKQALISIDDLSSKFAWQRLMIAFTRPIDTLIISLKDTKNPFSSTLLRLSKRFPDFVSVEGIKGFK